MKKRKEERKMKEWKKKKTQMKEKKQETKIFFKTNCQANKAPPRASP
jgi:hypothetical protein